MKYVNLLFLILLFMNIVGSCQTNIEDKECPDTTFSQTNLDTLEAKNPKFIWRVCNANEESAMENMEVNGDRIWEFSSLSPCTCSQYFSSVHDPIDQISFNQDKTDYSISYLHIYGATLGLTGDTSSVYEVPGRYSYHILRDTSEHISKWVEIEREAYH